MEEQDSSKFVVHISYVQPDFEELTRRFPDAVRKDYKDKRFDPIARCRDVSRENRVITFEYVHMDHEVSTDEVFAEMDRLGLRPALYEEFLTFAGGVSISNQDRAVVALGSEILVRCDPHVATLWFFGDHFRCLDLIWSDADWSTSCWFLAVRE